MARITKDDIRRILRLMNEATQRIDAEIKSERQAKPVRVNYGGSLVCSIEGYSPMADKLLSMKLDDLRNGTDLTTEYLHSMVADYIFDRLEGNYDDDGDEPLVRLKPGAILKRKVKREDFVGCRNITRIWNCMRANDIHTVGDLARLTHHEVLRWPNFGKESYLELCQVMKMWGVEFKQ